MCQVRAYLQHTGPIWAKIYDRFVLFGSELNSILNCKRRSKAIVRSISPVALDFPFNTLQNLYKIFPQLVERNFFAQFFFLVFSQRRISPQSTAMFFWKKIFFSNKIFLSNYFFFSKYFFSLRKFFLEDFFYKEKTFSRFFAKKKKFFRVFFESSNFLRVFFFQKAIYFDFFSRILE